MFFLAFAADTAPPPEKIEISAAQQQNLAALFQRTWGRPPTVDEQKGLVDAHIREEILAREAIALGLSDGDAVVRRRLAQKLEFLSDDLAAGLVPTDEELSDFLGSQPDRYRIAPRYSFRQIVIASSDAEATNKAANLLESIRAGADPSAVSVPSTLPRQMRNVDGRRIAATFGDTFSSALVDAPISDWAGPFPSAYGLHLIFIEEKSEARVPSVDDIRQTLQRDWRDAQRLKFRDAFYDDVRNRYDVTIVPLTGGDDQ